MAKKNKVTPEEARKRNHAFKENSTGNILKEKMYNKVIDRYSKHGNLFEFSDRVIWKGVFWTLPEIFGYMIFFSLFLFLAHVGFKRYGEPRTYVFFALLIMWRVQMAVKQLHQINKKLGD